MVDFSINKRNLGVTFLSGGYARFLLWAPLSKMVEIVVNEKQFLRPEMVGSGYWEVYTEGIKPGDTYQVKLDNRIIMPDPVSLSQPEGVHGPSRAVDMESFKWEDEQWKGISNKELIFYELHTGTFSEQGNFEGIIKKLDYLTGLGVTAVEIMPVAQFPGSRNWGYDGVFPFAVQNSYGGATGFQKLVNACHQNGLAVILDVVYNHLGPEGNYLNEYGPYFTDKYKTPWGKAINFDDEWCDGVRRYFIENMLMWFRDFHVDGLRLDAVHAIKDFGAKHILRELKENASKLTDITKKNYILAAEVDLNDVRYINSPEKGGYGLDMQWCDEFHHSVHALVTGEQNGYYSDFGELWQLEKTFNSAYVYDGIYSPHRKKTFGSRTEGLQGNKFIVFVQNHDQVGNRMLGERLSTLVDFETLKLAAGAMFISTYNPLIFMGEEYGETNPFLYFISHTDEELVNLVRKGRREEFKEFMYAANIPDPQSSDTFKKSKLAWDYSDTKKEMLLKYYKKLIELKKNHPVWKNSGRKDIYAEILPESKGILYTKKTGGNFLIALMNFDKTKLFYTFSEQTINPVYVLMNSSDREWGGENERIHTAEKGIEVFPHSMAVFSDVPETK
jgi:maltooligosyltrehalose trehalohydrolase